MRPTISVVVPTSRRPADLERCLAALERQERPPDEVLVVAREDDAETWSLLERSPPSVELRTVALTGAGVVAALDAGLEAARGDIVAITDDDAAPRPDWLLRIERIFAADPRVGGAGGRDWVHEGTSVDDRARPVVGKVRWYGKVVGGHHLGVGDPREVDLLKGANMSFRRAALEGIRLDERLRGGGAQPHWEIPLSLGVKRAGWKLVYDPAVAVDHYPAARVTGEDRWQLSVDALADAVHNETYALLRYLRGTRRATAPLYGVLVGTRRAPGVVTLAERLLRAGDRRDTLTRFRVANGARIHALRTFLFSLRTLRPGE